MKDIIKIGIDVDGVLRNFAQEFMDVMEEEHPDKILSPVISGFNFPNVDLPTETKRKYWEETHSERLFLHSKPYPDALMDFQGLRIWADRKGYKLVCVTQQPKNQEKYTVEWLKNHKEVFQFDEIHVINNSNKFEFVDFMVDDASHIYKSWINGGKTDDTFILINADYNQDINPKYRINRLIDVICIIK